jgi:hypothetical protein
MSRTDFCKHFYKRCVWHFEKISSSSNLYISKYYARYNLRRRLFRSPGAETFPFVSSGHLQHMAALKTRRRESICIDRLYSAHGIGIPPPVRFWKESNKDCCLWSGMLTSPFGTRDTGTHPQSPRHFRWEPSARLSQTLRSSCLSHTTEATTAADE